MRDLSLVILELACNSLDAGAKNLFLRLEYGERTTRINIDDDGCGFDVSTLGKGSSKGSTGLGLALTMREAQECGGKMAVLSQTEGKRGTRIELEYPKDVPTGDLGATVATLICDECRLRLDIVKGEDIFSLDTAELEGEWSLQTPFILRDIRQNVNKTIQHIGVGALL